MARHINDNSILLERVVKMLPRGVPASSILSVECDDTDGLNGGPSYWVYLDSGYTCSLMGCQTIHEDTLAKLKEYIKTIEKI